MSHADHIEELTSELFLSRMQRKTMPEGQFDQITGYWFPATRENHGATKLVKPPSPSWPHSFLIHCRSRRHCRVLIEQALAGKDVPEDALNIVTTPHFYEPTRGKSNRPTTTDLVNRDEIKRYVAQVLKERGLT